MFLCVFGLEEEVSDPEAKVSFREFSFVGGCFLLLIQI